MKKHLLTCLLMVISLELQAQSISWGGNVDFELRKGGTNSNPLLNQTPGPEWSLFVPNARLFSTVELGKNWWLDATLQSDYYGQAEPHPVFFSLLNVNVQPFEKSDFTIQAGRILIPFGMDHKRFIAPENPFANLGFDSNWNLRVDKKHGFIPTGAFNYASGKPGLAVVYQRRYTQGLSFSGTVGESKFVDYTLAITGAPASGHSEYNQHETPSLIGRVVFKPAMWAKIGLSGTQGSFMHRMVGVNDVISSSDLSSFKQKAWAIDGTLDYAWYQFSVQYTKSQWNAPQILTGDLAQSVPEGQNPWLEQTLETHVLQVESVVNLPFLPGTYVAGRFEKMTFNTVNTIPPWIATVAFIAVPPQTWMPDWNRFELVLGHKFTQNVTGKVSYQNGNNSGTPERDDKVITFQLTTLF